MGYTELELLGEVYRERLRQDESINQGKFAWTCAMAGPTAEEKLSVLAEEFGEVAKEVVEAAQSRWQS